jgi:hypothetical protein
LLLRWSVLRVRMSMGPMNRHLGWPILRVRRSLRLMRRHRRRAVALRWFHPLSPWFRLTAEPDSTRW